MKIISIDQSQITNSLSLNLGLSTFTSLISAEGDFVFLAAHIERLLKGAHHLFPNVDWPSKRSEIENFLREEFAPHHYFRIALCDDVMTFSKKIHEPKKNEIYVSKASSKREAGLIPSYVKNPNYLLAELEKRKAQERGFEDILFFDSSAHLAEGSTSNVFIVSGKEILTPPLSSCVLQGVTRGKLIHFLLDKGLNIREIPIDERMLESCSEIWFTNAIQGLRLVTRYENRELSKDKTLYHEICKEFGRFGEKFSL